jgi:hypothetical protein
MPDVNISEQPAGGAGHPSSCPRRALAKYGQHHGNENQPGGNPGGG